MPEHLHPCVSVRGRYETMSVKSLSIMSNVKKVFPDNKSTDYTDP